MLKFFRRIRKRLLESGKIKSYSFYAIGEIVLVVIGILIALQINNWNEQKKSRQSENKALIDLYYEFEKTLEKLESITSSKEQSDQRLRKYIHLITTDTIPADQKAMLDHPFGLENIVYLKTGDITPSVLSGLLNSGGIEKIENETLKDLLASWPAQVDRWIRRENHFENFTAEKLRNYYVSRIPRPMPQKRLDMEWIGFYPNNTNGNITDLRVNMVNDLVYQNLVIGLIDGLWAQLNIGLAMQQNCKQIMLLLKEVLAARKIEISMR